MKKLFIIANWKSNKTSLEAKEWLQEISNFSFDPELRTEGQFPISNETQKEIIVCPSFVHLPLMKAFVKERGLPIKLGAQNISPFGEGAYTGEVNGRQIKEFADYILIGHSERQKYFFENKKVLDKKIVMAQKHDLTPIYFLQSKTDLVPENISIAVYEPPNSISPGIPDTPENADSAAVSIKEKNNVKYVLYGGNVISKNVKSFTVMPAIDGVLVGRASLDVNEFAEVIKNA